MSIPSNMISISNWICLYPVYFDSTKTVQRGRRITQKEAVKHPLAKDIAEVVKSLGLNCALEPHKTHPQDWENPGRVKVELFNEKKSPIRYEIPTRKVLIKNVAILLAKIQQESPQQFPPPHSPAVFDSNSSDSTSMSNPNRSTSTTTPASSSSSEIAGTTRSSSSNLKKKGRKSKK
ncbi:5565_t:CDS:2 [Entrophospora sp. SA101]|nr:5565_t:CDS:2 [Entrophospora sp. SA101]CAJ0839024.1 8076_t:CDS:2 [Entrophospora sp. SA101]CAJ0921064.1 14863_t:CDS:2 [Entrophospora sp. SA101]